MTASLPRPLLAPAGLGTIRSPDQRDRDKANVELSTVEALLSIGTHIDKAVITAITPIAYQPRMSSGERCGRLLLRIGQPPLLICLTRRTRAQTARSELYFWDQELLINFSLTSDSSALGRAVGARIIPRSE